MIYIIKGETKDISKALWEFENIMKAKTNKNTRSKFLVYLLKIVLNFLMHASFSLCTKSSIFYVMLISEMARTDDC